MKEWVSQPLRADHVLARFRCGHSSLDDWLRDNALRAQVSGTAKTYVWTRSDELEVVGYFAIAPTQVARSEVTRSMSGGVGVVPGYLLARLALDVSLHGQGLGSELLIDALQVSVAAGDRAGGRLIVVDAIDRGAHDFYRHHGFVPIAGERRLAMKVATARGALEGG